MSRLDEENKERVFGLRQAENAFSGILYLGVRQAEPSKGVTPMVDITVKMDASTFIFVVLVVLKALRSANK